jgi:hypothetical protein
MSSQDVEIAILQTEVKELTKKVDELMGSVQKLTEVMNRGKGAFAASLLLSGVIGGAIIQILRYFFGGHG